MPFVFRTIWAERQAHTHICGSGQLGRGQKSPETAKVRGSESSSRG